MEGTFRFLIQLPLAHLCTTRGGGFTLTLFTAERQAGEAVNTNFYRLWFDPTWNRIRFYRFRSRRCIHLTTGMHFWKRTYYSVILQVFFKVDKFYTLVILQVF